MSDTLLRALDLIQPGDLVQYHGSVTDRHGLYIAIPCGCPFCICADRAGSAHSPRYTLLDPYDVQGGALATVALHVRRRSITRSAANA
ncbi:hypothetical protein [Streptomyces sp. DH12]|uniref:hypothetical protein n=1 Tax=Streptomyces sp. DH12 TaxID=2857010 RepID=UPI001E36EF4D|nr:hypothetical protein [Streptomyces sp. DH12]